MCEYGLIDPCKSPTQFYGEYNYNIVVTHGRRAITLQYTSRDQAVKTAPILNTHGPPGHSPYAYLLIGSREAFICGMP